MSLLLAIFIIISVIWGTCSLWGLCRCFLLHLSVFLSLAVLVRFCGWCRFCLRSFSMFLWFLVRNLRSLWIGQIFLLVSIQVWSLSISHLTLVFLFDCGRLNYVVLLHHCVRQSGAVQWAFLSPVNQSLLVRLISAALLSFSNYLVPGRCGFFALYPDIT